MIETKQINFNVFRIKLELRDDIPKGYCDDSFGGVDCHPNKNGIFRIWFKTIPRWDVIAHEIWHLFFTIMSNADSYNHTFDELNNEIYAYNFQHLYDLILTSLRNMKLYKKCYDEMHKTKENK